MFKLDNGKIAIEVDERGAELTSLKDLETGKEYIWSGDASIWPWHAPSLFPLCGSFPDGYMHEGRRYHLPTHGFLRDSEHSALGNGSFLYSSEGEEGYPFAFEVETDYILNGKSLIHRIRVRNTGPILLPCSMGFHTGYFLENAVIEFESFEPSIGSRTFICSNDTLTSPVLLTGLESGSLVARDANKTVAISCPAFSTLAIWSAAGHAGDFVCIELRIDTVSSGAREPFALSIAPGAEHSLEETITILK